MQKYEPFFILTTFFDKKLKIISILGIINGFEPHASEKKWYFCTRYLTKEQNYEKGNTGRKKGQRIIIIGDSYDKRFHYDGWRVEDEGKSVILKFAVDDKTKGEIFPTTIIQHNIV